MSRKSRRGKGRSGWSLCDSIINQLIQGIFIGNIESSMVVGSGHWYKLPRELFLCFINLMPIQPLSPEKGFKRGGP